MWPARAIAARTRSSATSSSPTIPAAVRRGLHATCAEIGEDIGMSLEARALHEYNAQRTFQALILLEQVATRAGGPWRSGRLDLVASPRPRSRAARAVPRRARRSDARGAHLRAQARRVAHGRGAVHRRRGRASRSARHGEARAAPIARACSVRSRRSRRSAIANDEAHRYLLEALELAFASGAHELLHSLEDSEEVDRGLTRSADSSDRVVGVLRPHKGVRHTSGGGYLLWARVAA